jgi:hypothetical protein
MRDRTLGRSAKPQYPAVGEEPVESNGSELLVEVVTDSIAHILNAGSLREALPSALKMIATVARIDRVVVIENVSAALGMAPSVFFVWTSDDAPQVDAAAIIGKSQARHAMEDLLRPLHKGMAVVIERRIVTGPMRELLTQLQVVSTLQVPIMLHGAYCGQLIFDDCKGRGSRAVSIPFHGARSGGARVCRIGGRSAQRAGARRNGALLPVPV